MRLVHLALIFGLISSLSSCAGYRFGGNKPAHLQAIQTIHIPLIKSHIVFPRVEAITTNTMIDALVDDGTYRLASASEADSTLLISLDSLTYKQARSSTNDVLSSEELRLEVTLSYELIDANRLGTILDRGKARGRTRLFVDDNLQTARVNALPDALRRAAQLIIARLADGI